MKLTEEQLKRLMYDRTANIGGDTYLVKDYYFQSEIRKNGQLFAMVKNMIDHQNGEETSLLGQPYTSRIEYIDCPPIVPRFPW